MVRRSLPNPHALLVVVDALMKGKGKVGGGGIKESKSQVVVGRHAYLAYQGPNVRRVSQTQTQTRHPPCQIAVPFPPRFDRGSLFIRDPFLLCFYCVFIVFLVWFCFYIK